MSAASRGRSSPRSRRDATTPQLVPLSIGELRAASAEELRAEESHDGLRIAGADLSGADLASASFLQCALEDCTADETGMRGARLVETRIDRMVSTALAAPYSVLRDVELRGSRIGAAELYGGELAETLIEDCKIGFLNLRGATLRDVVIRRCRIDELDLGDAELTRVAFEDCTASRLSLVAARCRHLDLRGLEVDAIDGVDGLRGATVTSTQLSVFSDALATHLGIEVVG